jgi:pyruvate/2-oxoglutarate dehydrogenase complex dihydrolipoamide acyltransferase (E2) component
MTGVLSKVYVQAGGKIDVGANFVEIDSDASASVQATPQASVSLLYFIS